MTFDAILIAENLAMVYIGRSMFASDTGPVYFTAVLPTGPSWWASWNLVILVSVYVATIILKILYYSFCHPWSTLISHENRSAVLTNWSARL